MSHFKHLDQQIPKVIIDNEDDSYNTFIKLLMKSGLLQEEINLKQLKCKKAPPKISIGNKFKKIQTDFTLYEGEYIVNWNGSKISLSVELGEAKMVTQCRMIEYLKRISISGQTLEKSKQFVNYIFKLSSEQEDDENITIYENNQGYWNISKEKRPRKLESVIFKPQFVQSVLADIDEFIMSEDWYLEMGIPYKRSYLLYGPPGTGKTSFAQAVAGEIRFSICFVNCSDKINDFQFNKLLNSAPKKSIILIEDVDAIFSERKNTEKNNALTFSGFLNAIDGVRSQEGRIVIMTTNFKERLDPALLRPGRVDQMYEINYASNYQIEKLCFRFYKNEKIAKEFAEKLPQNKFSMSMIQGYLLKFRKNPEKLVEKTQQLLNSDENVKIEVFLKEVNCLECLNDFRLEEIYTLAQAKNLCKSDIEKIATKLPQLLKGRLIETIRMDRKNYIREEKEIFKYIEQCVNDEEKQRALRAFVRENKVKTLFLIRDELKRLETQQKSKLETVDKK